MSHQPTTEPRPKLNDAMKLNAARKLVADMVKNGELELEGDAELYAKDIAKRGRQWIDGYELARDLERYHYWDCNLVMAEALDSFSRYADIEVVAAEKEWAKRNEIKPPLPNGTHVKLERGETGTIDGVYEHGVAKFCIAIDGDPAAAGPHRSRRIVNFEDVAELPIREGDRRSDTTRTSSPEPNLTESPHG